MLTFDNLRYVRHLTGAQFLLDCLSDQTNPDRVGFWSKLPPETRHEPENVWVWRATSKRDFEGGDVACIEPVPLNSVPNEPIARYRYFHGPGQFLIVPQVQVLWNG